MSKIYDFFLHIKDNPTTYTNQPDGAHFEKQVMAQLEELGYSKINSDQFGDEHKTYCENLIRDDDREIKNITPLNQNYVPQPFGSQKYPDLLILDSTTILCLELKFSKKRGTKPMWNSGLPRANGLYLFGSRGRKDITFFRGRDILSDESRKQLLSFFDKEIKNAETFNKEYMSNQEFGFSVYPRKAYDQKKKYNSKAITNFFDNHKRSDLEGQVLKYSKGLQHPN